MASKAQIQTVKADFLDPSLYEDAGLAGVPRLSRGTVLGALSRAFDLGEGRKSGHAQRVAYIGVYLASEVGLEPARIEDVYFGCLLHDVGMAVMEPVTPPVSRLVQGWGNTRGPVDPVKPAPPAGWSEVIEAIARHCEAGADVARRMGFGESVARAVLTHHDCWDGSGRPGAGSGEQTPLVGRIVALADRFESLLDAEAPPLALRRNGPRLLREMAGRELDPDLAERMAAIASRDEFWLGLYDNDLGAGLMALNYGGVMGRDELFELLGVISDVIDVRNGRSEGSGRRIAELARRVALYCDMTERRADLVKVATLLHDIGTLGVPARLLRKPDILSVDEMSAVQMHPIYARDILGEIPGFGAAAWWVGCHHERIDGKGYPGMLEGSEVPVEAQIIGMCETYDALTNDRPYRRAQPRSEAFEILRGLAGNRFDTHLLARFESVVGPFDA